MPIYEYICSECTNELKETIIFELSKSISERDNNINCPYCEGDKVKRKISNFSFQDSGMTASMKSLSNPANIRKRIEMTKHLKDARIKRKAKYERGTNEHESNELWAGSEIKDGVIPGPNASQSLKFSPETPEAYEKRTGKKAPQAALGRMKEKMMQEAQ